MQLRGRRGSYVIQRFCVSSRAARGGFVPQPPVPPSRFSVTSLFWPPRSIGLWLGRRTWQSHAVDLAIGRFRARRKRTLPSLCCSLTGHPRACACPLRRAKAQKHGGGSVSVALRHGMLPCLGVLRSFVSLS